MLMQVVRRLSFLPTGTGSQNIHTKEGEGDGNTIYDVDKSSERTHRVTASVRVGGSRAEKKEPGCPTRIRSALPLRPLRLLGDLGQVT